MRKTAASITGGRELTAGEAINKGVEETDSSFSR